MECKRRNFDDSESRLIVRSGIAFLREAVPYADDKPHEGLTLCPCWTERQVFVTITAPSHRNGCSARGIQVVSDGTTP